jgi:hypothetical protein
MTPNMSLEAFLPPSRLSDIHLLLTKDWNGVNNGIFFIRVREWSVALLSGVISYPSLNPNVPPFWADQPALSNLLDDHEYFIRFAVCCPLRWLNVYVRSSDG